MKILAETIADYSSLSPSQLRGHIRAEHGTKSEVKVWFSLHTQHFMIENGANIYNSSKHDRSNYIDNEQVHNPHMTHLPIV